MIFNTGTRIRITSHILEERKLSVQYLFNLLHVVIVKQEARQNRAVWILDNRFCL